MSAALPSIYEQWLAQQQPQGSTPGMGPAGQTPAIAAPAGPPPPAPSPMGPPWPGPPGAAAIPDYSDPAAAYHASLANLTAAMQPAAHQPVPAPAHASFLENAAPFIASALHALPMAQDPHKGWVNALDVAAQGALGGVATGAERRFQAIDARRKEALAANAASDKAASGNLNAARTEAVQSGRAFFQSKAAKSGDPVPLPAELAPYAPGYKANDLVPKSVITSAMTAANADSPAVRDRKVKDTIATTTARVGVENSLKPETDYSGQYDSDGYGGQYLNIAKVPAADRAKAQTAAAKRGAKVLSPDEAKAIEAIKQTKDNIDLMGEKIGALPKGMFSPKRLANIYSGDLNVDLNQLNQSVDAAFGAAKAVSGGGGGMRASRELIQMTQRANTPYKGDNQDIARNKLKTLARYADNAARAILGDQRVPRGAAAATAPATGGASAASDSATVSVPNRGTFRVPRARLAEVLSTYKGAQEVQ